MYSALQVLQIALKLNRLYSSSEPLQQLRQLLTPPEQIPQYLITLIPAALSLPQEDHPHHTLALSQAATAVASTCSLQENCSRQALLLLQVLLGPGVSLSLQEGLQLEGKSLLANTVKGRGANAAAVVEGAVGVSGEADLGQPSVTVHHRSTEHALPEEGLNSHAQTDSNNLLQSSATQHSTGRMATRTSPCCIQAARTPFPFNSRMRSLLKDIGKAEKPEQKDVTRVAFNHETHDEAKVSEERKRIAGIKVMMAREMIDNRTSSPGEEPSMDVERAGKHDQDNCFTMQVLYRPCI